MADPKRDAAFGPASTTLGDDGADTNARTETNEARTDADAPAPSPLARSTAVSTSVRAPDDEADDALADDYDARYARREKLGEGGMGEVHVVGDNRIGREVAMKVVRAARGSRPDVRRRFLREARVQGQLEHPSIVPVYDLGRDPDGAAFFTMKRVRGVTLEQVLDGLRDGDAEIAANYTRHKLLTAFGNVCLAVHFAHTRGVLHRDLKPSNVMLGDFGEVYVLDWGLAKTGLDEERAPLSEGTKPVSGDSSPSREIIHTGAGAVLGTPGYMSPEQIGGDVEGLDARTDVYALGAVLFEILTLKALHGLGDADRLMLSTQRGVDARPSARAPERDVPPELDAVCARACALEPRDRYPTARAIYDAVEGFLSGDRDVARRRELAREHATAAAEATERALVGGASAIEARRTAMREVSRAVALDPENADALRTLGRLFTEMPRELPSEARAALASAHVHSQRVSARTAGLAYLSWLLYSPFVLWMGLRDLGWGLLCDALWLASGLASLHVARSRVPTMRRVSDVVLVTSMIGIACAAGLFGPFTLLPGIAVINTLTFVMTGRRSRRVPAIALGALTIVTPLALEGLGVLPPSMRFEGGALTLLPRIHELPQTPTIVFLLVTNVAVVLTASIFVARFRDALVETERRLHFQAWQLRQLVPAKANIPSKLSDTR